MTSVKKKKKWNRAEQKSGSEHITHNKSKNLCPCLKFCFSCLDGHRTGWQWDVHCMWQFMVKMAWTSLFAYPSQESLGSGPSSAVASVTLGKTLNPYGCQFLIWKKWRDCLSSLLSPEIQWLRKIPQRIQFQHSVIISKKTLLSHFGKTWFPKELCGGRSTQRRAAREDGSYLTKPTWLRDHLFWVFNRSFIPDFSGNPTLIFWLC